MSSVGMAVMSIYRTSRWKGVNSKVIREVGFIKRCLSYKVDGFPKVGERTAWCSVVKE